MQEKGTKSGRKFSGSRRRRFIQRLHKGRAEALPQSLLGCYGSSAFLRHIDRRPALDQRGGLVQALLPGKILLRALADEGQKLLFPVYRLLRGADQLPELVRVTSRKDPEIVLRFFTDRAFQLLFKGRLQHREAVRAAALQQDAQKFPGGVLML